MKSPAFLLVVLAGLIPLAVFTSLIVVPANVKWQPPMIWNTTFGTPGSDSRNGITKVATDKMGIYAVGYVGQPKYSFSSPTPSYAFLDMFDFSGQSVWSRQLGNLSSIEADTVNIGPDGLYISGIHWVNQTTYVEKHDFNGNKIWTRYVSQLSDYGLSIGASGIYIASLENGSITMKSYDLNGSGVWTRSVPNETGVGLIQIAADQTGFYLAGSSPPPSTPNIVDTHAFVARYDSDGRLVWSRQFDNPNFECACVPFGLSEDSSGIYVGGVTYDKSLPGEIPFNYGGGSFLRKYDLNGSVAWTTGEAGSGIGKISTIQSGVYSLEGSGQLSRYDGSSGSRKWIFSIGSGAVDLAAGEGGVYIGGIAARGASTDALLEGYDQSPSFVFAGLNPPYSFLVVGSFCAVIITAIFFVRWRSKKGTSRV